MSSRFLKMMELPLEIVVEILDRVPVKDLIRFRCVCKSWRSLFLDERFIGQHMTHAPRMVLSSHGRMDPPWHFFYESGKQTIPQELDLNIGKDLLRKSFVMGHCHGLFFLHLEDDTFGIWNPSLRELRRLQTRHIYNWAETGFGYDYSTQDYKIVLVPNMEDSCYNSKAHVLSLKSGVSRMIDFPRLENFDMCNMSEGGTLVGEHIYWRVCDNKLNLAEKILSFDLVSETFNYYPNHPTTCDQPLPLGFEVLRGGLCTVGIERGDLGDELVIWSAQHEKENNGVIKSWSKILRLPWGIVENLVPPRADYHKLQLLSAITYAALLLFVVHDGEETKLLEYNLEEKSLSIVKTSLPFRTPEFLQTYIETLVPIPGAL